MAVATSIAINTKKTGSLRAPKATKGIADEPVRHFQ
jgi:hypothetical protein